MPGAPVLISCEIRIIIPITAKSGSVEKINEIILSFVIFIFSKPIRSIITQLNIRIKFAKMRMLGGGMKDNNKGIIQIIPTILKYSVFI